MGKPLGKAAHWGAWRLPTDRKDQKHTKQRGRRREDRSWRASDIEEDCDDDTDD